jgi:hypothetical protein
VAPGHVDLIRALVVDVVSPEELGQLGAACERILTRLRTGKVIGTQSRLCLHGPSGSWYLCRMTWSMLERESLTPNAIAAVRSGTAAASTGPGSSTQRSPSGLPTPS